MTRSKNKILVMATPEGRDALKEFVSKLIPKKDVQRYVEELIFKDSKIDIAQRSEESKAS